MCFCLLSSLLCDSLCCFTGLFCWKLEPETRFRVSKWLYLIGYMLTVIATWVLRDYASEGFYKYVGAVKDFCGVVVDPTEASSCAKGQIAMRISLANVVFFSLHCVGMLGVTKEGDPRVVLHSAFWPVKILLWAGLLVAFFFVPAKAILQYAEAARYISSLFLIIQVILLVYMVYEVNDWLTRRDDALAWTLLIGGSVIFWCLGLALIGICYHFYAASPSCHLNIFFITWSLIVGLILAALLFVPNRMESAGLLTSGAVFLYCSYLLTSALTSEPTQDILQCIRGSGNSPYWISAVGFFLALGAVAYQTIDAGSSSHDMFGIRPKDGDDDTLLPYRADFFHFIFVLASMYVAMLFSNWEVSPSTTAFQLDRGWISTWVKMGSKWACEVVYGWSVIAPAIFRNRDFSGV